MRIGLTGSIGVGKTFVAGVLAELGCHVLDADQAAREVVAPGSAGLSAVVGAFGDGVLQEDGTLDRQQLGSLIFDDQNKRQLLNSILHPYILALQDEQLREWEALDPEGIGVVDAALMIESGGFKRFDKLIVVHCRPEVQIKRLMARDNLTREKAQKRIDAQMPQEVKRKFADYLIDTSEGFESVRKRTGEVYEELGRVKME
ncbi:MAG TPA: dephospho-CoA kinase, partial [Pyrinomonadaceae bacterium]|nr:dephospho-CoA kinase [Pyrinomonadaceae bacterium]